MGKIKEMSNSILESEGFVILSGLKVHCEPKNSVTFDSDNILENAKRH